MRTESFKPSLPRPPKLERRGRRPTFLMAERARLAELIRQHGIRQTQRIAGVSVSCNTLIKIGREFHIPMPHGRGGRRAA